MYKRVFGDFTIITCVSALVGFVMAGFFFSRFGSVATTTSTSMYFVLGCCQCLRSKGLGYIIFGVCFGIGRRGYWEECIWSIEMFCTGDAFRIHFGVGFVFLDFFW